MVLILVMLKKVPGTTSGVAPIFVTSQSSNSIFDRKGANQHLSAEDIDRAAVSLKMSYDCAAPEIPLETVYHAIEFGNKTSYPSIV